MGKIGRKFLQSPTGFRFFVVFWGGYYSSKPFLFLLFLNSSDYRHMVLWTKANVGAVLAKKKKKTHSPWSPRSHPSTKCPVRVGDPLIYSDSWETSHPNCPPPRPNTETKDPPANKTQNLLWWNVTLTGCLQFLAANNNNNTFLDPTRLVLNFIFSPLRTS